MAINNINYSQDPSPYYIIGFDTFHFHKYCRPHMSIGYKVPQNAHFEQGTQKRVWKKKVYPQKDSRNGNNPLSLPNQTTNR